MTALVVIAHAGHWLVQLLYLTPLIVLLVALAMGKMRERRGGASEDEDPLDDPAGLMTPQQRVPGGHDDDGRSDDDDRSSLP
jgi:hypothetical protein